MQSLNGQIAVQGTFNSTPNTTFRVEFFSSETADDSGYGEGETFLGFQDITTDVNGNANIIERELR